MRTNTLPDEVTRDSSISVTRKPFSNVVENVVFVASVAIILILSISEQPRVAGTISPMVHSLSPLRHRPNPARARLTVHSEELPNSYPVAI